MHILFDRKAWQTINLYIQLAEGEISGLARGVLSPNKKVLHVSDVRIWPQECTSAETEVTSNDELVNLALAMQADGAAPEDICVWWHSHANMQSFFSTTDDATITNWVNNRFLCAIVGNKAGDFKARIDVKEPIQYTIDEKDITISHAGENVPEELYNFVKNEIETKVTTRTYQQSALPQAKWPYPYDDDTSPNDVGFRQPKLTKEEQRRIQYQNEIQWAEWCMCDHCFDFLREPTKHKFNYKQHTRDKELNVWEPKELEQKQISEKRLLEFANNGYQLDRLH